MSYYGSNNPPPLPPRSPRPADVTPFPAEYPNWSYPPPPPGSPQGPNYTQDLQPPPMEPRPPGYEITTAQCSSNIYHPLNLCIPPPPPEPPLGMITPVPASSPLLPRHFVSGSSQRFGYTPTPSMSPAARSPSALVPFSPPPPRLLQNTSSPNLYRQKPSSPYQHASQSPVNSQSLHPSAHFSATNLRPSPVLQLPPSENPYIPVPTYTPLDDTKDNRPLENGLDPSIPSSPPSNPASNCQSSGRLLSSVPAPASPEDLEARFQSLTVESPPIPSLRASISYQIRVQSSDQGRLPDGPETSSPSARVSHPNHPANEYPMGTELKNKQAGSSAGSLPALMPSAVTSCIDSPLTFATEWYWHPDAPEFLVCSRCYVDHIYGTMFKDSFRSERLSDGTPRVCRFSKPRMRDHLFRDSVATGSLESALKWMRFRPVIPDCKGVDGIKGEVGIKWYSSKSDMIPGFVSCEACYEDYILTNHFSANFEPSKPQPAFDTWACDIAVPFIEKEYKAKGELNDWAGFVSEAKARISMQPCPQRNEALTYGKKWFIPKGGPDGLVLCSGCYCDQVIHTGQEANWEVAERFTESFDKYVRCGMGIFSIRVGMSRAHDTKDFGSFWTAMRKLSNEKFCEDDGIEDGVWYTLPSYPRDFGICAGCYVAIAEPLNVARFFVRKRDAQPAGTKWRCCFSVTQPRFRQFMQKLLEMYYTLDSASFDQFATVYSSMPVCPRDEDAQNKRWYGWMDCTICPECYNDFAQHSPLAAKMDMNDTLLETSTMCEMYSPRMRNLYKECGAASPPDAAPLLKLSVQRRLVWMETVPQMRMMLFRAKMALDQQQILNAVSSHYKQAGMLEDITDKSMYTYGAAGVGYGYANMNLLQGAIYGQQATAAGASAANPTATMLVGQLEQRWKAVE